MPVRGERLAWRRTDADQKRLRPKAATDVRLALAIVGLPILIAIAASSVPGLNAPM